MTSRFFRLPVSEIAYVRAIVDSYDGLAVVRSAGRNRGEMEWIIAEGREVEADGVAQRLAIEAGLFPIDRPEDWSA